MAVAHPSLLHVFRCCSMVTHRSPIQLTCSWIFPGSIFIVPLKVNTSGSFFTANFPCHMPRVRHCLSDCKSFFGPAMRNVYYPIDKKPSSSMLDCPPTLCWFDKSPWPATLTPSWSLPVGSFPTKRIPRSLRLQKTLDSSLPLVIYQPGVLSHYPATCEVGPG